MSDPNDPRPLRVTIFPEHPQTILIFVPAGQSLWLPNLPTPFDLDRVCDALDDHDIPHNTQEGDTGRRWTEAARRMEAEERAEISTKLRETAAIKHVRIQLSPTATTPAKQRSEVVLTKIKVDTEIGELKGEISKLGPLARTQPSATAQIQQKKQRLKDLQQVSIALAHKLTMLRQALRVEEAESAPTRERLFISKARRFLSKEHFLEIWAEIDAELAEKTTAAEPVGRTTHAE